MKPQGNAAPVSDSTTEVVGARGEARQASRLLESHENTHTERTLAPTTICRVHGVELAMTLAGVANHCRRCERESAHEILTVERASIQRLRDELETREMVRID